MDEVDRISLGLRCFVCGFHWISRDLSAGFHWISLEFSLAE